MNNSTKKETNKIWKFLTTSIIGGFVVLLPITIITYVFVWLFNLIIFFIKPLSDLVKWSADTEEFAASFISILIIIIICFVIGTIVKTSIGKRLHILIDTILYKIPGYNIIKETIEQFLNKDKAKPFSKVALVRVFDNDTLMTAFVTDSNNNGDMITVFVPTAPNPTNGFIYHVNSKHVYYLDISVEDAMRSVIGCGVGSCKLMESYNIIENNNNTN